jgi:hypothetical protein
VTVSVCTERVLFSCKSIWMSSGGGPDPLDPPLIYAIARCINNFVLSERESITVECNKSRQKQFPVIVFPQNVIV